MNTSTSISTNLNIVYPTSADQSITPETLEMAMQHLKRDGHCLLRGFEMDMTRFSGIVSEICDTVTFDPAREYSGENTQKVDAGTDAIGLHVENGNTPRIPDLVAFYSRSSARVGSQTTLCDGSKMLAAMSPEHQSLFAQAVTVSRTLPERLWKSYLVNEHPLLTDVEQVEDAHLQQMLAMIPGQRATINPDRSLDYQVTVNPLPQSKLSRSVSFANAVLGPSFNYQPPVYTFADGRVVDDRLKCELAELAERFTVEIPWQDGDVALIDNQRVMHGRREILDESRRELFIGMGSFNAAA